jgi:hypothetical protein
MYAIIWNNNKGVACLFSGGAHGRPGMGRPGTAWGACFIILQEACL